MKIIYILFMASLISSCASLNGLPRSDGVNLTDKNNAVIIGEISEGFLTQPHGLLIRIDALASDTKILLQTTKGNEDDIKKRNILGHKFMYEVPPGEYKISFWGYYHYAGFSIPLEKPIIFSVKSGEISYIGNMHANSLTFCLSNTDRLESEAENFKIKFPIISSYKIIDKTDSTEFYRWGHDKSESFAGKEACNQPVKQGTN